MGALYWKRPTKAEAASIGCVPEDYEEPKVEVWEENWQAVQIFRKYSTQWRMGPGGPCGLDYAVIQFDPACKGLSPDQYDDLIARLGVIEQAALTHIHKTASQQ